MENINKNRELLRFVSERIKDEISPTKRKSSRKLYYISAEFLTGKLLVGNAINLGIYDELNAYLKTQGTSLTELENEEPEPSLGNGGLGRLAACFLDSMANLGLNAEGIGLLYHYGLFRQVFRSNKQTEEPNPWLSGSTFLQKTDTTYKVDFGNVSVTARLYLMDIIGRNKTSVRLSLFDIESADENIVKGGISFDKSNFVKNLTLFLYPDDSDEDGRLLRVYQEYFMVSCAAQKIIDECVSAGSNLYNLSEYAVIQINDTHPSLIIPELIRLLIQKGMPVDDAIEAVSKTVAYTNHTILAEALEKWPVAYLKKVAPAVVPIIEILDDKVRRKYNDSSVYIIDDTETVHMAHLDIHYSFSINGVAKLHTEILKETELNNFYKLYPEKFNNKTNGITFSRWLLKSNPELTRLITSLIGNGFKEDPMQLERLKSFADDTDVLDALCRVKHANKLQLKSFLKDTQNIDINENAIFDMQIKRLHEYKRQQMNVLYLINKYLDIKRGNIQKRPICAIFGAKASPAYTIAKDIIHLILCLSEVVKKDSAVNKHLDIVMVENYNVTSAEVLIPACDISEQISLASKEASGTSNMKFILNGAVILGTEDGANVEIHNLVGDDNIYIFGDDSDTVIERYKKGDYCARKYYESNAKIKEAVDFITSPEMLSVGSEENLKRLQGELIDKDWFMTFPDFDSYAKARDMAYCDFENRHEWAKKMLINISDSGHFSSDRTILEYNRDIWKL